LPRADRVTLLADGWALVAAEKMPPDDYFALIESSRRTTFARLADANRAFERSTARTWPAAAQHIASLCPEDSAPGLRPHRLGTLTQRARRPRPLRSDLIWALGGYGDSESWPRRVALRTFVMIPLRSTRNPRRRHHILPAHCPTGRPGRRWRAEGAGDRGRRARSVTIRIAKPLNPALAADTLAIALVTKLPQPRQT